MAARPERMDRIRALAAILTLLAAAGALHGGVLTGVLRRVVTEMRNDGRNAIGLVLLTRNYYEELTDVDRGLWRGGPGWDLAVRLLRGDADPDDGNWVRLRETGATRDTGDYVAYDLAPDVDITFMGVRLTTNRWGMRDVDRTLEKPEGTVRIAIVGASNSMGYGVEQPATFAALVESGLNRDLGPLTGRRYEVLNFSVGGYRLPDLLYVAETRVPPFRPDLILVELTPNDLRWSVQESIVGRVMAEADVRYDLVRSVLDAAGVRPGDSELTVRRRLRPFREPLISACFMELARIGADAGVPTGALHLRLRIDEIHDTLARQADLSDEAGLITLRIFDGFEGRRPQDVYLSRTDLHPSAFAHGFIAEEILQKMYADERVRAILGITTPPRLPAPRSPS
ncbi:MAG: SGNH/GDSL hydrolase family protein [Phycisphaeraceae bacterium]|nr:SGNH/GDSL hydrolase family protein [Phycisphaeraceae bacterium]